MATDRISPTAHYTGYTWFHNGLSHPSLATAQGRVMYHGLRPLNAVSRRLGTPTLEGVLLARHRSIDAQLEAAIESGAVSQVIEIAAGLSPRGWDFARRYGDRITYIEADLPDMAAHKRRLLVRAHLASANHRVVELDALAESGPRSLAQLADSLDPTKGVAIITEGLINYFPTDAVLGMWRRFATTLRRFPTGLYLSDLHLKADNRGIGVAAFMRLLSTFVRGSVYLHFESAQAASRALADAGFEQGVARIPDAVRSADGSLDKRGARMVRVVRAETST
ncbi:O-methyltransferase involved in polyketide biosynthesis [Panacagrimonas perspica]|uniref:O-methyltransferase involved in polyketide biosynthesis n=1 Tax=Panacagrimonas perspica TaxID=381431 RepID=A0A4S3K1I2_9GAMM|nr:class I SAM-dependent methyltransferase [Panacagrimonas perspica]TDU31058.1 O-methyltransferase involved in polyketide biosynthesis [Panacagrimonas perspica]THD01799.1 hypothetical protein B1810_17485 [Panacagrimonas perspica]